jgi:hypothetical protein
MRDKRSRQPARATCHETPGTCDSAWKCGLMRKVNLRTVRCTGFVLVLLFVVFNTKAFAQAFQPSQILSHSASYAGKRMTVSGTVQGINTGTSHQGKEYLTFDLCDRGACMKVFAWGHAKLMEGQHLSVSGTFDTTKHVEPYTFQNVLEAHLGVLP